MLIAHKSQLIGTLPSKLMQVVEEFIDQQGGFSFEGERALVRAIDEVSTRIPPHRLEFLFKRLKIEWKENWADQETKVRGSPLADGLTGIQNRVSIENLYLGASMASFLLGEELSIPNGYFTVKTRHSTYSFGEANLEGVRTVRCSTRKIPFTQGKIEYLALAKSLVIKCMNGPQVSWSTTPVIIMEWE